MQPDQTHMEKPDWLDAAMKEHRPVLYRYALSLIKDPMSAEDAVQETFLRLCRTDQASVSSHLRPWLFRVCRNYLIDRLRKEQRMELMDEASHREVRDAAAGPDNRTELRDTHAHILRIIEGLSAGQREVMRLKFQSDMSYKEIAEITNRSVNSVGVLLHLAIARVRQELEQSESLPA